MNGIRLIFLIKKFIRVEKLLDGEKQRQVVEVVMVGETSLSRSLFVSCSRQEKKSSHESDNSEMDGNWK